MTDPWLGHVIDGRYRLDKRVAEGGFGTVFQGFHVGLGRPVAVKLLRVEREVAAFLGEQRGRMVDELRAEGATLQKLSTQTVGVVQALDVGDTTSPTGDWAPYLVLEWVDGEQLGTYSTRRGPLAIDEIVQLLEGVASALGVAHANGIAHRDIKPGNILVTQVGSRTQTKLLDFGVAKVMTNEALARAREATHLSFVAFTPAWAAPEQFNPSLGHTGAWTDVYAFALVVVSMLVGRRAYEGSGPELAARALDRESRPTPRTLGARVSDEVERVLARAVAIDPRNRYAKAAEFWEALVAAALPPEQRALPPSAPMTLATGEAVSSASAPATALDLPAPLALFQGRLIGGEFRLIRELSRGGMGAVYVALQISTGKNRALKLMHPSLVAHARLRERFEQEARVGSRIDSEHVVDVIGAGVDAETAVPWLAMELLEGEDLASYGERRGPLPVGEVVDLFEQLTHAVGAAHRAGVVHRDLKPENIFLASARHAGAAFTVKVLDFGIAKVVADAQVKTTSNIGTPLWMAPEQADARAPIGPAADVWSLGLIAFRLLTGVSYWQSGNEGDPSSARVLTELLFGALPAASERARELGAVVPSAAFDAWFARCVDRDPGRRFANAHDLFVGLRALPRSTAPAMPPQWKAPTEPMGDPAVALHRPQTVPMPPSPAPVAPRRASMWLLLVGATVFSALVAVVMIMASKSDRTAESSETPKHAKKVTKTTEEPPEPKPLPVFPSAGNGSMNPFAVFPVRPPLDFTNAAAACASSFQRVCTESQWVLACGAHPEIAATAVRTVSWDEHKNGWIDRGGGACSTRGVDGSGATPKGFRCCTPGIFMQGFGVDAAAMEALVRRYEVAANSHDAAAVAALFTDVVTQYISLKNLAPKGVQAAAQDWFDKHPEAWDVHERCTLLKRQSSAIWMECRKIVYWGENVSVLPVVYGVVDGKLFAVDERKFIRPRRAP